MRILSLKLDYTKLNLTEEDKKSSPIDVSIKVINAVLYSYVQQYKGVGEQERKLYYKLQDIFADASLNKIEFLSLEDDLASFLRKVFRETKLTPNNLLRQVEENIEKTKEKVE